MGILPVAAVACFYVAVNTASRWSLSAVGQYERATSDLGYTIPGTNVPGSRYWAKPIDWSNTEISAMFNWSTLNTQQFGTLLLPLTPFLPDPTQPCQLTLGI